MAVLFLSHSSRDDAHANVLEAWLGTHDFTDVFVDHSAIAGGEKWREALKVSAGACRVVVCLVTPNWLGSAQCFGEFMAAWYMGKRILPLFLLPGDGEIDSDARLRLARVQGEDQGLDMGSCLGAEGRLDLNADEKVAARLLSGLKAAGVYTRVGPDPEAFPINKDSRPTPFPGLASFGDDDADAAIFYGRSGEIARVLEDLRSMRARGDQRALVILGASGAGKSSLLKAGIIPRLRREVPAWLPLRAFRPGADPLLNFSEALARTLRDFAVVEAHGVMCRDLFETWRDAERDAKGNLTETGLTALETKLGSYGRRLREASARPDATILIGVDQAEELARADGESGEALAAYLRVALAAQQSPWRLAFTIRTDSFPELQGHRLFQNLETHGYDLRSVAIFRFVAIVEEPAKRYGVTIDGELVEALMDDAPKADALPLLAFALQRLWDRFAASGEVTKRHYDGMGRLAGLIEDAAERALRGLQPDQPVPAVPPLKRLDDLGAATFVPALAQINDEGATIRRVSAWSSFDEEQQHLLERFDHWRLIVRKGEKGEDVDGRTVEVAHEALFREWPRLKAWLEPERARLEALRLLQADSAIWGRNNNGAAFLNHRDQRLDEANALAASPVYGPRLNDVDLAYLAACETAEREAERRSFQMRALVGVLAAFLVAGGIGWVNRIWIESEVFRLNYGLRHSEHILDGDAISALESGDDFKDCVEDSPDCPAMVIVPAGSFKMGSIDGKGDPDEHPQRDVVIDKPFAVSRFEVTFAEWNACVAYKGCAAAANSGWEGENRPVINVDLEDAKGYSIWLSRMTGKTYRLLSEAEWEYAARAGTISDYSWGDEIGPGNANCDGCGSEWDGKQTAPVGSFKPNAFGLYDMHGNVWEWVADPWKGDYSGAPTDGSVWTSGGNTGFRVLRGGSWYNTPENLRSADRVGYHPDNRFDNLGFRVGRTLTP